MDKTPPQLIAYEQLNPPEMCWREENSRRALVEHSAPLCRTVEGGSSRNNIQVEEKGDDADEGK